jgi:hypothetical protein
LYNAEGFASIASRGWYCRFEIDKRRFEWFYSGQILFEALNLVRFVQALRSTGRFLVIILLVRGDPLSVGDALIVELRVADDEAALAEHRNELPLEGDQRLGVVGCVVTRSF